MDKDALEDLVISQLDSFLDDEKYFPFGKANGIEGALKRKKEDDKVGRTR